MDSKYEDNWPFFEKVLGHLHYLKIRKYIFAIDKPVCVDIGCGFDGHFLRRISRHISRGYGFDIRANEVHSSGACLFGYGCRTYIFKVERLIQNPGYIRTGISSEKV